MTCWTILLISLLYDRGKNLSLLSDIRIRNMPLCHWRYLFLFLPVQSLSTYTMGHKISVFLLTVVMMSKSLEILSLCLCIFSCIYICTRYFKQQLLIEPNIQDTVPVMGIIGENKSKKSLSLWGLHRRK